MAKLTLELDIDFLEENEDGGVILDDAIQQSIKYGIEEKIVSKIANNIEHQFMEKIAEKTAYIQSFIDEQAETFFSKVFTETIENLMMPYRESNWSREITYIPISEYVGKQYENFLNNYKVDERGNHNKWDRDNIMPISEYLINEYMSKELGEKIVSSIQAAKEKAEKDVIENMEKTLQQNLAVDTIKRMNIPAMLAKLQQNAIDFEEKHKDIINEV